MDLRQLQHFLTVLEHGSLKRAASDACVSQQGLSASIKALEDSLGVQLLDRGRHGAVPTAAGLMLADRAKEILGTVRLTRAELKSLSIGQTGTAVMGSGPFFAQRMVPKPSEGSAQPDLISAFGSSKRPPMCSLRCCFRGRSISQ
jgi:DNA-binding transcriptional LysR family regulator